MGARVKRRLIIKLWVDWLWICGAHGEHRAVGRQYNMAVGQGLGVFYSFFGLLRAEGEYLQLINVE